MGVPIPQDTVPTNPGGTGTTITIVLPTHQEDDEIEVAVAWKGIQAPTVLTGWTHRFTQPTGTASNGLTVGVWWRRVGPSETISNPTLTIGTTAVERVAVAILTRGADIDNPANNVWQRAIATGNSASPTPPTITTLAPNYLVYEIVACRGNSAIGPASGYTELEDTAVGTTICLEVSHKTQTTAATLSGQAASISSNRWVAAIIAIPSPDYPYFRSQTSQTATATSITGTLPTGTTAADFYGRKDLIIATVEAAGTAPSPNVGADWTSIATWETTTSGGATTVRQYWALYDGSISLQFNRTGSGEISLNLSTYRNPHQTVPIGNVNVRQNASSTTSTWDALTRSATKSTVAAMCIADGVPSYTAPAGWTEREDGLGMTCADQIFEAGGSTASASFTLSTASPTAIGLVEVLSHAGVPASATLERSAAISATADIVSAGESFSVFSRPAAIDGAASVTVSGESFSVLSASAALIAAADVSASRQTEQQRSAAVAATADIITSGARVVDRSASVGATASIESSGESFTVFESAAAFDVTTSIESSAISFSVTESATSVSAVAVIEVVGVRITERSSSLAATATVESSATFFSVVSGAAQISAVAAIESSAEFFSVFERQSSIDASAAITTTRQVELARSASLSAVASIEVTGGIAGGAFEHERSAAVNATGAIESSAISFSVVEAASTFTAVVSVSVSGQRDLHRSVAFSAVAVIESSGGVGVGLVERAASFSASATVVVSGEILRLPPLSRTFVVESGRYEVEVSTGNYEFMVDAGDYEEDSELQSA